jgi:probable phosphoglycerate mutase
MTNFHLVRHASHDLLGRVLSGRTTDVGLNDKGRAECAALAEYFAARPIAAIYSSPIRRAIETAQPISGRLGVDLQLDARLIELDFGAWNGAAFDALEDVPEWRDWNVFRSGMRPPGGGETMVEAQARIAGAMVDLKDRHDKAELVLLSHGDVIKAVLAYWAGIPLDLCRRIEISPASISTVALDRHGVSILQINQQVAIPG